MTMTDFVRPAPPSETDSELLKVIRARIGDSPQGSIPFADFMEMALYEPKLGYYAASHRQLGPQGDFVTSAHLTSDYGELIAVQILELWEVLNRPDPFTVVEMGPGQGLISADALSYLLQMPAAADCVRALSWCLVETSEALIRWQRHYLSKRLEPLLASSQATVPLRWTSLEALRQQPFCGCLFSNELLDALPFHLLQFHEGEFAEVCVAIAPDEAGQGELRETLVPLSPDLAAYVAEMIPRDSETPYPEGYRCEVNLAMKDWVADVAACLKQGYVLTIDYGYPAHQLYSPSRQGGTLQCFTQQKSHDNPYLNIGNQDITCHVNFTAIQRYGEAHQLDTLGMTQQGLFLMALGLGDRLSANNANTDMTQLNETLQRRDALHALMNPLGLGGFQVLLQGKGLTPEQKSRTYRGFQALDPIL